MVYFSHNRYLPIEDYAVIGDLHTVALVGLDGSIDWCCLPRFDSPSVFGALLDAEKGGFFRIAPVDPTHFGRKQIYLPETNILLTHLRAVEGVGEITDFMPIKRSQEADYQHYLIRSVSVSYGAVTFELVCRPAFNYARDPHSLALMVEGAIFRSQHFSIGLASPIPLKSDEQGGVHATFTLYAGQSISFVLETYEEAYHRPRPVSDAEYHEIFEETSRYWRNWISQCTYQGRWREMVHRSALVLKLLTYAPTGAIVAAPTTSLPEALGGDRNWDYRFTWLRDASFTVFSLLTLGFTQEAEAFMRWVNARCDELVPGSPLQPIYGIGGEQILTEEILDHLEGYRGSRPVRIGNDAYSQKQLDVYGEIADAIYIYNRYDAISYDGWQNVCRLLAWLKEHWREPDEGIWEVRGGVKHFVHSRLMSWVAFDRSLRVANDWGWPAPTEEWDRTRKEIYQEIMEKGWNPRRQSFVQYYGADALDASSLLMMLTNFAGRKEPRILSTIEQIKRELTHGVLVRRYLPERAADDGFGSPEGAFSACSFWLVENLARAGYLDEARLRLEKLLSYSNHVGLFAEEISPTGEAWGNYPQAFTHLALITSCYHLNKALNERPGYTDV